MKNGDVLISLEDGVFGRRAVLKGSWSDDLIGYLRSNRVAELELNQAKGWRGADFSFLTLMPDLLSLEILDLAIKDIHHIHVLRGLRRLGITTYCGTSIDFGQFQQLESCGLEWRAGAESVFGCQSLRKLFINRFDGTDLSSLSGLPRLESLAVLNGPLKTLRGIESVRGLTSLRLAGLTRLTSLAGVEALLNLEELEVHTCRQIGSIDHIGALPGLRRLGLNNCGKIESLKPIDSIKNLESVIFYESTNIVDGDLSPLTRQRHLNRLSFQNRRHYSHRREDFSAYRSPGPPADQASTD